VGEGWVIYGAEVTEVLRRVAKKTNAPRFSTPSFARVRWKGVGGLSGRVQGDVENASTCKRRQGKTRRECLSLKNLFLPTFTKKRESEARGERSRIIR